MSGTRQRLVASGARWCSFFPAHGAVLVIAEIKVALVHPELVEQHAELGVVLVVADAVGDEVGLARGSEIDGRGLIGELSVGLRPELRGGGRFGGFGGEGAANRCVELRIAELAEVVVTRRVGNEARSSSRIAGPRNSDALG